MTSILSGLAELAVALVRDSIDALRAKYPRRTDTQGAEYQPGTSLPRGMSVGRDAKGRWVAHYHGWAAIGNTRAQACQLAEQLYRDHGARP